MIVDLNNLEKVNKLDSEICIIGGGLVGLYLANKLRSNNLEVTVIEAGNQNFQSARNLKFKTYHKSFFYGGADSGRNFGLGGTSVLWGGQMLPLTRSDIENRTYIGTSSWPIKYKSLCKYYNIVKKDFNFSLINSKIRNFNFLKNYFLIRFSTWLPIRYRNFYSLFSKKIKSDNKLNVFINSQVIKIKNSKKKNLKNDFIINNLIAISPNGNVLNIKAKIVIICCGALESTKLMLVYNKKNNNFITSNGAPLGLFFSDHLSVICGKINLFDWKKFNLYFSPIFRNGLMSTPRFELNSLTQKKRRLPSAFVHFNFNTNHSTYRDVLKYIFKRKIISFKDMILLIVSIFLIIKDIYNLFIFRFFYRIAWFYKSTKMLLEIDIEQIPNKDNRIFLVNKKNLAIDWRISSKDIKYVKIISNIFAECWNNSKLKKIAIVKINLPSSKKLLISMKKNFKAPYHPTGTIRMGNNPKESVVDKNLKVWKVNNCYVLSTAVFPSSGSANTGMCLLALANRLSDHISKNINKTII
jgi:hypothetical protein